MLKKKLSHFLSLLIVAALVITGLPVNVLAETVTNTNGEGVTIDLSATDESLDEVLSNISGLNALANDANDTSSTAKNPEKVADSKIDSVEKEEDTKEEIKFDSSSAVEAPATDFEYTIEDSKVTIDGYIGSATEVVIPAEIEGYPVTSIGDSAFSDCSSLTSITLPEGLTSIGWYAFEYCYSLTSIMVSEDNTKYSSQDGVLFDKDKTIIICCPAAKNGKYVIPDSVTSIGDSAFYGCESITSITIPEGVTSIGDSAFSVCRGLTSINIPNSVTSIGDSAFRGCSPLTSITVSENNTKYSSQDGVLFDKDKTMIICCPAAKNGKYVIPDSVTSIGNYAFFRCESLTSITLPEGLTSIGNYAFFGCESLTSITLPEGLTSIGWYAFEYCYSLTSITLPEGVTSIGNSAFYNCYRLTSITLPEGLMSIGDYAFYSCYRLTSINIPNSVTSIGDSAFCWCSSLTSITIPEGVTSIGNSAFSCCSALTSITVSENNTKYSTQDGVLFDKDKTAIICCPAAKNGEYVIPDSVTSIGACAFSDCSSLTSITLPEGLTSIGNSAFSYCSSLTSITLPEGLTSIGDSAFEGCYSLTSITIPRSVTSIGDYAFHGCSSLTSITLPEGLTSIGDVVFVFCDSLISIVVPKSIKSIGNRVFEGCFKLKNVYYTGTEAEWNAIEIAANNDSLNNATIHFNYVPGAIPEEITPSEGSNVVVDTDKSLVSGIAAESKPAAVIAQFDNSNKVQIVGKDGKLLADDALVGTGCKVQLVENGEVKDEVTVVIKGEIDGNGKIDSNDAIYLLRNTLFPQLYKVVVQDDVDGNGEYNSNDAIHLLRHTLFPGLYPLK